MKSTEYLMSRKLEAFAENENVGFSEILEGSNNYILTYKGIPFGSFKLLPYSNGDVYFYEYEIEASRRGQGIGTMVFSDILNFVYKLGYKNIRLQVSSLNPAALAIYSKYEFEIVEVVNL